MGCRSPHGPRCSHLRTRPGDSRDTFRRGGHYGKLRQNLYMLGQLSVTAQGRGGGTGGSWPHAERAAYLPDHPPCPPTCPSACLPLHSLIKHMWPVTGSGLGHMGSLSLETRGWVRWGVGRGTFPVWVVRGWPAQGLLTWMQALLPPPACPQPDSVTQQEPWPHVWATAHNLRQGPALVPAIAPALSQPLLPPWSKHQLSRAQALSPG